MKKNAVAFLLLTLAGCGSFGQGLRDGFEASLRDSVASSVSSAVADRLDAHAAKQQGANAENTRVLAEAVRELPGLIPKPAAPAPPPDNTVSYGIAFLLAKLVGDGVGGLVRSKVSKREA